MGSVKRRYSKEEFAKRGDAIYEKEILPKLAAKAGAKLRSRLPEAQIWVERIGYAAAHSFGGRQVRQELP